MTDAENRCPCGCHETVAAGCSYAGRNEKEREVHRGRANRRREAGDRQRQARQVEAQGVLAELGLDAEAPAHLVAQTLEDLAAQVSRLAVVVAHDLHTSDIDHQREAERVLRAEHRAALLTVQVRLDESSGLRRVAEQGRREAEVAAQAAELAAAQASAERDAAVTAREEAERARQASEARAKQDANRAGYAVLAAQQAAELLAAAEAAQAHADAARADAEHETARARSEVRDQQLRTAQILAEQERRTSETLTAALASADRRAVRDRRAAVREVRASLLRDRDQLRAELAVALRERDAVQRTSMNPEVVLGPHPSR